MPDNLEETDLSTLLPDEAKSLLEHSGLDFVENEGIETVRDFTLDVFMGRNFRNATEMITRRRISTLNLGLLQLYLEGLERWPNFLERLPYVAARNIELGGMSKGERWLNHWILGLTDKAFQNVLRDDPDAVEEYAEQYIRTCEKTAEERKDDIGELEGEIGLASQSRHDLDWKTMAHLKNAVGASTLTIRGSDKSTFGKLFEKLILGPLLHVLDFKYVHSGKVSGQEGVYWLSSTNVHRESDATLVYKDGVAFRFDIGFIGRGNPEIILDKVTRFQNRMELGQEEYHLRTVVIADRVGDKSRVKELAKQANGYVVTMDSPYWPRQVAEHLDELYGFEHPLVDASDEHAKQTIEDRLESAPLKKYLRIAKGQESDAPDVEVEVAESSESSNGLFDQ